MILSGRSAVSSNIETGLKAFNVKNDTCNKLRCNCILNFNVRIPNKALPLTTFLRPTAAMTIMGLVCQSRKKKEKKGKGLIIRPTAALRLVFHWPGRSILGFRLTHICSQNLLWRAGIWVTDCFEGGGGGHGKKIKSWKNARPNFCELYIIWGSAVTARD